MHRSLARLGFVLVVGACAAPSEPSLRTVTLTPTANDYAPGALISATLVNGSEVAFTYGACTMRLERLAGIRWIVAGQDPRLCIGVLSGLAPNGTNTVSFPLASEQVTGTYRLRLQLAAGTDGPTRPVLSRQFRVVSQNE